MLVSRLLSPGKGDIFYHYCSSETLLAIAESKTIRFSDINMMNDAAETKYGYEVFEKAAGQLLSDERAKRAFPDLDRSFLDAVDEQLAPSQLHSHPVVACFSRSPDLLSQWRAYADDGRGFAIGFRGETLKALPASLLAVEYDASVQVGEMKTALGALFLRNREAMKPYGSEFWEDCQLLAAWKHAFKHPSFAEEQEIRCLHMLRVDASESTPKLLDEGGVSEGRDVDGQPVRYRTSGGSIVPYVDILLPKHDPLFSEIWVGPKSLNGPGNILYPLGGFGLTGFSIHPSASTYR